MVISKSLQHGLGKQYPAAFVAKDTVEDNLGRPVKDIRSLIASLETELGRQRLQEKATRLEAKRSLALEDMQRPEVRIGRVQSGDTVMKSGTHRDRVAAQQDVIAFEMEGAGAWDEVPCIIIKGICDYADSHKNKIWQPFAAATAASVTKAVLGRYARTDGPGVYLGR
ncbi:hypothetical protein LQW54_013393 [Pestalotiopsis sp. IQ-011]